MDAETIGPGLDYQDEAMTWRQLTRDEKSKDRTTIEGTLDLFPEKLKILFLTIGNISE